MMRSDASLKGKIKALSLIHILLDRAFELYCQGVPWARDYFAEHNEIRLDGDARSAAYLSIDESPEAEQHLWHVRQIFLGENADGDFRIEADVNLDATQEEGEVRCV